MAQALQSKELTITPEIRFDKDGIATNLRTYFICSYQDNETRGWSDYSIGNDGQYIESRYDPIHDETTTKEVSASRLETLSLYNPHIGDIRKILGNDRETVERMFYERGLETRFIGGVYWTGRLRACSQEEMQAVAMQAAQEGGERTIEELINMVEGGIKNNNRRSLIEKIPRPLAEWRGLRYGYEAQLLGIKAMAQLEMPHAKQALKYLARLNVVNLRPNVSVGYVLTSDDGKTFIGSVNRVYDIFTYPNAKGPLRDKLDYRIVHEYHSTGPIGESHTISPQDEILQRMEDTMASEPHSVLREAMQKLENTCFSFISL